MNKKKYIKAHKELIEQYKNGTWTGHKEDCPLCKVEDCECCTLFRDTGTTYLRCYDMKTYDTHLRQKFHEEAVKILEELPEERFGMEVIVGANFPELWELDRKLWEDENNEIF